MIVILDLDDYSPNDLAEEALAQLQTHFPNFKVNLFAPAMLANASVKNALEKLPGSRVYLHGFKHTYLEMDTMDYDTADKKIDAAIFHMSTLGISHGRTFKAPYWRYSDDTYRALKDYGFIIAISNEQYNPPGDDYEVYRYDYGLEEGWENYVAEYAATNTPMRLHGHCTPYVNDISLFVDKLVKFLPETTDFQTIDWYTDGHDNIL